MVYKLVVLFLFNIRKFTQYFILVDKYYIVDAGLRNTRGFLAPFKGMRYHLQDYRGSEREPKNGKELFNYKHTSLRNVIERTFGA